METLAGGRRRHPLHRRPRPQPAPRPWSPRAWRASRSGARSGSWAASPARATCSPGRCPPRRLLAALQRGSGGRPGALAARAARRRGGDPAAAAQPARRCRRQRAIISATLGRVTHARLPADRVDRAAGGLAARPRRSTALAAAFAAGHRADVDTAAAPGVGRGRRLGYLPRAACSPCWCSRLAGTRDPRLRAGAHRSHLGRHRLLPLIWQSVAAGRRAHRPGAGGGAGRRARRQSPAATRRRRTSGRTRSPRCRRASSCWATCRTSRAWRSSVCPAPSPATPGGPTPGSGSRCRDGRRALGGRPAGASVPRAAALLRGVQARHRTADLRADPGHRRRRPAGAGAVPAGPRLLRPRPLGRAGLAVGRPPR